MNPDILLGDMAALRDVLINGNRRFVDDGWDPAEADLTARPTKELAVVACMDTRNAVERVLGLDHGDAKIIRNAGNHVDDGTLRSLVVAVHLLGVKHVCIMGHTKCGMTQVGRGDFTIAHSISDHTEVALHEVMRPGFQHWLGGFDDPAEHVRRSVDLVKHHPYMPSDIEVFGLLFDNDTGTVSAV